MTPTLTVRSLLDERRGPAAGAAGGRGGLGRRITVPRIQKPGLALAGYTGRSTPSACRSSAPPRSRTWRRCPRRRRARPIEAFFSLNPACVVVTKGLDVPAPAARGGRARACRCCARRWSRRRRSITIQKYLELQLAPTASIHGVLMDVLGVGILLLGKSGIGKTEAALDLVMRGHRLVADDIVEVRRTGRACWSAGRPSSSSTTWRSAASASSTSRTCSASPRCATRRRSSW